MNYSHANVKLHEIANELKSSNYENYKDIGVLSGLSGIGLFLFHYYDYTKNKEFAGIGRDCIVEVINRINNGYRYPTYCGGISGALWAIEYLNQYQFIEFDSDGSFSDLDLFLLENMKRKSKNRVFDFLHDSLGYGYYFLKRYQTTKSTDLRKLYYNYIADLIDDLYDSAMYCKAGVYWKNGNPNLPPELIDIGLAHGQASIVNYLANVSACNIENKKVRELLDLSISFILDFKNYNSISVFPKWIVLNSDSQNLNNAQSRLAWCYGDLGIAISLVNARRFFTKADLLKESTNIALKSCLRKSKEETEVVDFGLCHGCFGIAIIYKQFYSISGNSDFKIAAEFWLNEGLKTATFLDGLAGFKKFSGSGYKNETHLLDGIAGAGLALMSFLSPKNLHWEECLMIKPIK
jgi:lantibiotic modifying enzyme